MNISVVIPLLNEQNSLEELTSSVSFIINNLKLEFEIILIDDGSTDNSWKIISKKTLHLNTEHEYILFFGLIREYKGLETLIKSMPKVLKLNPNLKLLIVGENYISMKKYNQLIEKLNISKNVIIKNTFIDDDKIKYWFSSSELVIIPYKKASQSGITSLSLQFEVPTVSSNIDGLNEVINDNITGYLFNSNYDELASKINYAIKSDKKNIIKNIIKIKKELTWESFITQIFKNI